MHYIHKAPPENSIPVQIQRKKKPKFPTLLKKKILNQKTVNADLNFMRNDTYLGKKATFLNSFRGVNKTQRETISYDRFPSNFSSIKKNLTCRLISATSYSNELLLVNCMNSPTTLKKTTMKESEENFYTNHRKSLQSIISKKNPQKYNDNNESNRVYYDRNGETIKNEEVLEIENTHSNHSRFSEKEKNTQFKSETNRTSEIVEEYSDLMTKNSKIRKFTNQSEANSQRNSSYYNFDKEKSSRNKRTNGKKYLSSNSILTHTQQEDMKTLYEKIWDRLVEEKNYCNCKNGMKKYHGEFEVLKNFKFYSRENNSENVIKNLKK